MNEPRYFSAGNGVTDPDAKPPARMISPGPASVLVKQPCMCGGTLLICADPPFENATILGHEDESGVRMGCGWNLVEVQNAFDAFVKKFFIGGPLPSEGAKRSFTIHWMEMGE